MRYRRALCSPLALLLLGSSALAHGRPEGADPVNAAIALSLGTFAALYGLGLGRLWARAGIGGGVGLWRALAVPGAVLVLVAALLSPLEHLADEAFAWHMGQHLLLILLAAPLLVLGSPLYVLAWVVPLEWRRKAARFWRGWPSLRRVLGALTHPLGVWLLATGVFWLWHLPALYGAAVRNDALHALEHLGFSVTAAMFWWALLQPHGRRRLERGAAVVYLFATMLQGSLLGALLTFAPRPLYAVYAGGARDALSDQQLAGLIMWVPSGVVYLALSGVFCAQWLRDSEARQLRREGRPLRSGGEA